MVSSGWLVVWAATTAVVAVDGDVVYDVLPGKNDGRTETCCKEKTGRTDPCAWTYTGQAFGTCTYYGEEGCGAGQYQAPEHQFLCPCDGHDSEGHDTNDGQGCSACMNCPKGWYKESGCTMSTSCTACVGDTTTVGTGSTSSSDCVASPTNAPTKRPSATPTKRPSPSPTNVPTNAPTDLCDPNHVHLCDRRNADGTFVHEGCDDAYHECTDWTCSKAAAA